MLKTAQPKLINLQTLLRADLSNPDAKWECEAEIRVGKTLTKQGQSKIDYIDKLAKNLNDQVLRAPIKVKDTDEDTSESRMYQARTIDEKIEELRSQLMSEKKRTSSVSDNIKVDFKKVSQYIFACRLIRTFI